jgi:hypothetical protein
VKTDIHIMPAWSILNQTWVLLPVAVVWFLHWLSFATLRHTTRCVHNAFCNIINQHCFLEEKRWYGQSTPRSTHIYSLLKQLLLIIRYYIKLVHDVRVWPGKMYEIYMEPFTLKYFCLRWNDICGL